MMKAVSSSTTMDFSCVKSNVGLLSRTLTPADFRSLRVFSFSDSPLRRAGFNITRTLTPRFLAAITAWRMAASEKTNILIRSDLEARLMASRIGRAESSGKTINDRDITSPLNFRVFPVTIITTGWGERQFQTEYDATRHKCHSSPLNHRAYHSRRQYLR